jgi:hypothetical protein
MEAMRTVMAATTAEVIMGTVLETMATTNDQAVNARGGRVDTVA